MIVLHRLGHCAEPFHLNPELIVTVEALPDTVIALATGARIVVGESPQEVAEAVREWRAGVLAMALHGQPPGGGPARAGGPTAPTAAVRPLRG